MGDDAARVMSVNIGRIRTLAWNNREITSAIHKTPVSGRRLVRGVNVDGDDQADRSVHGGPYQAVYAYDTEDYRWWASQLDRQPDPGTFGENLTTTGLDLQAAVIGERWRVGTVTLRVTQPRIPCYKLGIRMDDPRFPARFAAAGRPGAYLAIEHEGSIGTGDEIVILSRPEHGVTVGMVERAYHVDRALASRLLTVEELPAGWRQWARSRVEHRARRGPG
jgi:MOSC domain-containing protein YiiM